VAVEESGEGENQRSGRGTRTSEHKQEELGKKSAPLAFGFHPDAAPSFPCLWRNLPAKHLKNAIHGVSYHLVRFHPRLYFIWGREKTNMRGK